MYSLQVSLWLCLSSPLMEETGFLHGRLTIDQVTLLTQDIEESFLEKKTASAVFVDIIAAYDTVWHCSLTCKLLHFLPNKNMVKMIIEFITNHSFTLIIGSGTCSRLRLLKNGIPQGSILAPILYNIYTYHLPTSAS